MSAQKIGRFGPGLGLTLALVACSTSGAVTPPAASGSGSTPTVTRSTSASTKLPTLAPAASAESVAAARAAQSAADLDRRMAALWDAAHVVPTAASDDAEFLRRVTLDVGGRIPTLDEVEHFLDDRAPDKRARLVTALLASPDYAEHWGDIFLDLFVGRQFRKPRLEKKLDPRAYFVTAFRENRGFDRIAREMLTFSGEILPNGPGVFLASHLKGGGPEMAASVTARLFMGVQIQCAQCHDHPYDDRYKQEDFYALVAYFARTKHREQKRPVETVDALTPPTVAAPVAASGLAPAAVGAASASKPPADELDAVPAPAAMPNRSLDVGKGADSKIFSIIDRPNGQAKFKKSGADRETVVRPKFFGREVSPLAGETLRETLARAVVGSDLFAKTMVDRTWTQLFGRGIVDPWDDLGGEKDPRHPALLTALADDFRSSGFDVKHLLQTLLLSKAYGLTSRTQATAASALASTTTSAATAAIPDAGAVGAVSPAAPAQPAGGEPSADPTLSFARASVRRLTPEQLFRSVLVATGADHMERPGSEDMDKKIDRLLREYLFVYGDDEMAEINTFNGNIPQALLMWNGEIANMGAKARAGGTLAKILDGTSAPGARLRKMFLTVFSRLPTEAEQARILPVLSEKGAAGRAGYEDLFFAMLSSTEMLTVH